MEFPNKKYSVIYADPPWSYRQKGAKGKKQGYAAQHYNTMTISWGGLGTLWRRPVATVYVKKNRYTFEFMEQNDYFTVSF